MHGVGTLVLTVSSTAEGFESLFSTFSILGIIVGAFVLGLMALLVMKYREKGHTNPEPEDAPKLGTIPQARGKAKTLLTSLSLSTLVLIILIAGVDLPGFKLLGTFEAIDTIQSPPEKGTLRVDVTGFQWAWKFKYPNKHEVTNELRVPVGEVVILNVTSNDVFHNFGIIDFKIKIDAIRGRFNRIWFVAKQPGEYSIQCFELCGVGHAFMKAKLIVMEPNEFQKWYSGLKVGT